MHHTQQRAFRALPLQLLVPPLFFLAAVCLLAACTRGADTTFETLGPAPANDGTLYRIQVSSNARHVAWLRKEGPKQGVTIDGTPNPTFDTLWSGESFSPDGEHFVYVGNRNRQDVVVLDGKELPTLGKVTAAKFSPDSAQIAYMPPTRSVPTRAPRSPSSSTAPPAEKHSPRKSERGRS